MKNLLLLSNSTLPGEPYFSWPLPYVKAFTHRLGIRKMAFVPFAAVTFSFDEYERMFQKAMSLLGIEVESVHHGLQVLQNADAVAVGGGNTFALLKRCYEAGLVEMLREKVNHGMPYMGWSAGSNLACPRLCTTNDMPIVEPPSFNSLGLVPFQINPHYTEKTIEGHGGESRMTRLMEFLALNEGVKVAAVPEGCLLEMNDNQLWYKGMHPMKVLEHGKEALIIQPDSLVNQLLK
ncbi:dipeptidase PepE [bacterium]|nr:dipeptidase PepE [bacterium]